MVIITFVPQISERNSKKQSAGEKDRTVACEISVPVRAEFLACWLHEYWGERKNRRARPESGKRSFVGTGTDACYQVNRKENEAFKREQLLCRCALIPFLPTSLTEAEFLLYQQRASMLLS